MNRLLACRVCLAYDTRLCSIMDGQLGVIYEKLVEASLDTEDMLPTSVCYMCYSLMKKMLQFRDRSQKANQILQQMISSGLEPSVSSLDMLVKDQTGISWTLGMSDVESTTTTSANDKVKLKIESVEPEMDMDGMSDQNEDHSDSMPAHGDSTSDSEDGLPLQNKSEHCKTDRVKMKTLKVILERISGHEATQPDARAIVLSKEVQLQEMRERAKSVDYSCSEAFVDARAHENHKQKHDELSVSSLDILDWHNGQTGISNPLGISDIKRTTTTTGVVEVEVKIESVESEMDIDEMSDRNEGAAPPANRKLDKNEAGNELINIQAPTRNTEKDEEPKEKKEVKKKIPAFKKGSKNKSSYLKTILKGTETTTSNIVFDKNDTVTPPKDIFTCDLCKNEYQCKIILESHIKNSHVIALNRKDTISSDLNVTNECKITNLLKAQETQKNDNRKENDRHENKFRDNSSQYECQYCMKRFSCKSHLILHLRVHTKGKPFKCDICEKCFSEKDTLTKHLKVHTKEKPFKCDICEKGFPRNGSLTRHYKVHTKEKPFKCDICEKCFSEKDTLTKHVRVHTKEKPFKCDICEKGFSRSSGLTAHLIVHTKEKPFKCDICGKCFSLRGNFAKHVRVHTKEKPFNCDLCEKSFSHKCSLIKHVRVHTKEKPFKCEICEKGFSQRNSLIKHVRVHTKEKPFNCDLCEKSFLINVV